MAKVLKDKALLSALTSAPKQEAEPTDTAKEEQSDG